MSKQTFRYYFRAQDYYDGIPRDTCVDLLAIRIGRDIIKAFGREPNEAEEVGEGMCNSFNNLVVEFRAEKIKKEDPNDEATVSTAKKDDAKQN